MPDFDVAELDETPIAVDADEQNEKLEEKKMAEIIVKLQMAKQKAAEAKKVILCIIEFNIYNIK